MASILHLMFAFALDIIAFGLAIAAEQLRSTAKVVPDSEYNYTYCVYDSDIATCLGFTAFAVLLASQILTMKATGCFCFSKGSSPGGYRICSIFLSIICWVTFFIAEACLVGGSVKNAQRTKYRSLFLSSDHLQCQTLRKGVFEAGAGFILVTSLLSKLNYVCSSKPDQGFHTESTGSYISLGGDI